MSNDKWWKKYNDLVQLAKDNKLDAEQFREKVKTLNGEAFADGCALCFDETIPEGDEADELAEYVGEEEYYDDDDSYDSYEDEDYEDDDE